MGRRRTWWIAALAFLAVAAAASVLIYRAAVPSAEDRARAVLEAQMRDPASLMLRNVREVDNGVLCGEFNARNGFGGYTGYRQFYIVGSFVAFEDDSALPGAVAERCG